MTSLTGTHKISAMPRLRGQDRYSEKASRRLRRALLSVHYHTVGREFEVRGAPSVLLPPEVDPMSLRDALAVIAVSRPPRLNEALWRVVRSVPFANDPNDVSQYPSALGPYLDTNDLIRLNQYRSAFRRNSEQFSFTLQAIRGEQFKLIDEFPRIASFVKRNATSFAVDHTKVDFTTALKEILGYSDNQYFDHLLAPIVTAGPRTPEQKLSEQIAAMGNDVGLSIKNLVETLADIAAFETVVPDCVQRQVGATKQSGIGSEVPANEVFVYPVNTIIKQQTRSMAVSATVTTIVRGNFETLTNAMNPAHWACSSDVIQESRYVDDIFTLSPSGQSSDTPPEGEDVRELLDEKVKVSWDDSKLQQAQYHNVLNTKFSVRKSKGEADVYYNLCRSIKSSILWDRGPGGLLQDQGYIKLRRLGENVWRVTMHKELLFGDANGSGAITGPRDLDQLISYLAPVALTYWLESEIYSLGDPHPKALCNSQRSKFSRTDEELDQIFAALKREFVSRRDGNG